MKTSTNLRHLNRKVDRRLDYSDRDPEVERVAGFIRESGLTTAEIVHKIYEDSGHTWMPHYKTIDNILNNVTKRPANRTIEWIACACGWTRGTWRKI